MKKVHFISIVTDAIQNYPFHFYKVAYIVLTK